MSKPITETVYFKVKVRITHDGGNTRREGLRDVRRRLRETPIPFIAYRTGLVGAVHVRDVRLIRPTPPSYH